MEKSYNVASNQKSIATISHFGMCFKDKFYHDHDTLNLEAIS